MRSNPHVTPAAAAPDPADPPLVAALIAPLLELRGALGDGVMPTELVEALKAAADATVAADVPASSALYALESTGTATAGVPVIRRTATEVSALADHYGALSRLLGDAYATRGTAAAALDAIIAGFRHEARTMVATATSQADVDAIVGKAAKALGEGVSVVNAARAEMDDHRRRAVEYDQGPTAPRVTVPGNWQIHDGRLVAPGTAPYTATEPGVGAPQPVVTDPATAAQIALQNALIQGGVALGTAAIDGAVTVGTKMVDGIVQVATHGVDTAAKLAEEGLSTWASSATGTEGPGAGVSGLEGLGTGPGGDKPAPPASPAGGLFAGLGGPARPEPPHTDTPPDPAPAPAPKTKPAPPASPQPPAAPPPPPPSGAVVPPAARPESGEQSRPRRTTQPGMTLTPGQTQ
ncbi:hypothetical protein [Nocardia paucivorans]|uniref:hypothetical protein n=1 Tax=Nocardia paucivorans TaxID=114259 RepID=UPI00030537D8|nr:hypothetical protein [Nocardia paucivorans]